MNKHTLRQYRAILREIEHLEAEKEAVLGSLGQPKSDGQPNGKGRIGDPVLQAVAKRAKLQKLIDDRLDRLIALREEIETAIADLPATERDLMRLRYIDGMTWERIAVELNYSYQWTLKLHGRILQRMVKEAIESDSQGVL